MQATHHPLTTTADVEPTPADILRGAARYLELHGWTQGDYYARDSRSAFPPACLAGAIGMAAFGRLLPDPHNETADPGVRSYRRALDALVDYLDLIEMALDPEGLLVFTFTDPFAWNDTPTRTAEQVITTLRAAADEWDRCHARGGEPR